METPIDQQSLVDSEWSMLVTLLPDGWQEAAYEQGAIRRNRKIDSPGLLLRMLFAYAVAGYSLRAVAVWAEQALRLEISGVDLLRRFQRSVAWLDEMLYRLLHRRAKVPDWRTPRRRLVAVDASTVTRPGSHGTDWRIHLAFDLGAWRFDDAQVTDASGGETLTRFDVRPGDIVVADRAYPSRAGLAHVASRQADSLVRMTWQNLPLDAEDGTPFNVLAHVSGLDLGQVGDWPVRTRPTADHSSVPGRVVAMPKSPEATEETRRRLRQEARKKGRTPDERSLEAAGYLFVFTTLDAAEFDAVRVLDIYRFRWQVERAFRSLKGLLLLDEMQAKEERLCRAFLLCKLIAAVLVEQLRGDCPAFPPWGYGMPAPALPVAD